MTKKLDIEFPRDFYLDDVGVWRLKKEKITELEASNVQTNEEWFCGLSTEEKAKIIVCLEVNALHKWKEGLVEDDVAEIKRWLKEKHQ